MIIRGFCTYLRERKEYKIKILNNKITLKLLYETDILTQKRKIFQQEMIPEDFCLLGL